MAESHFNDPYVTNNATADRRQQDAQKFNQMVQMLSMANRASGQTMLGFALGKLLRDTWLNYKNKRNADARAKGANTTLGGEGETADQQAAEKLRQQNVAQLFAPYHRSLMDVAMANTYNGGRSVQDGFKNQFMQQAIEGARKASTPEAQQFYADQKAHPEWFEGDTFVGWDPAAHEKFRAEHPDYVKSLAAKIAQPTASPATTQTVAQSLNQTAPYIAASIDQTAPNYQKKAVEAVFGPMTISNTTGNTTEGRAANANTWDDSQKFMRGLQDTLKSSPYGQFFNGTTQNFF